MSQKKHNKKIVKPKATIQELQESRDGGQIALRGFTYQFLYSCYLLLSELDANTFFHMEGIEDIDQIEYKDVNQNITHVQLKYSIKKQDASFLKDVLKNFLEAYLIENTRNFKLVYDFSVAKGNMSKLFTKNLDDSATIYWTGIIDRIKVENPCWNWSNFSFQDFVDKLSFEKREKDKLADEIEIKLIKSYDITTDNVLIYANSIKIRCLEKMEQRASIDKSEIDCLIQSVKDDISKGPQNPAHNWIKRLSFDLTRVNSDSSYFEGKKATPQDIALNLPIRRLRLEQKIEDAIHDNRVTVIKASSGQGKTTLALQVSFNLLNDYTVYQLSWCNDFKELNNIVQFFKSRVRLGEKPLILIDNLDPQVSEWNRLAQLLQEEVSYNYKLLLTTREDDWYSYGGDLSNVKSIQIIKLSLEEEEARKLFEVLKKEHKIHQTISDWRKAWVKVADKKLLIEYMYLLTHGEMIAERVDYQISQISKSDTGKIKCEILRKVCFADICGIKLPTKKLISNLSETSHSDYGDILKSIDNEFLIRVNTEEKYIEGLHPVRSQHIVDRLHEFSEINDTALQVAQIADERYLPKLFSNFPQFILKKSQFYFDIATVLWNNNDLTNYVLALQGLFSGSVMQYFYQNRIAFDDANAHGGLFLVASELNPFIRSEEFDVSLNTLDEIKRISPDNSNIQYLCNLRDTIPKLDLSKTDVYYFCKALYNKLKDSELFEVTADVSSYSKIAYWLYNIDSSFDLSKCISLQKIWDEREKLSIDVISSIMYTSFCGNKDVYLHFVEEKLPTILSYLKAATKSLKIYINEKENAVHVEYILLLSDAKKGNEESVSRLKAVCKTLPIYEIYCSDAIKPNLNALSSYAIPDDAHKTMPIRNIIIMFYQEFASLWSKTIMSNYECDTISEWLEYWFSIRKNVIMLFEKSIACICKFLEGKPLGNLASDLDQLRHEIGKKISSEIKYPNEDRPFEEKAKLPKGFSKVKSDYFQSIQNFSNQFAGLLLRDIDKTRLATVNLKTAQGALDKMQMFFTEICNEQSLLQEQHSEICIAEYYQLEYLLMGCLYFQEHQPSKYFNKYQIKVWYGANYTGMLNKAQNILGALSEKHLIVFPRKYYVEGILNYYPFIVNNLDVTTRDELMDFLISCVSLIETSFDYFVILLINSKEEILPTGLNVSKRLLADIKQVIETDDAALAQKLTPPFPIEITPRMLDCFDQDYRIFVPIESGYKGIDRIGELLWEYSKITELLNDECDAEYRGTIIDDLKKQILNVLYSFKPKISRNNYDIVCSLCNAVFDGQVFNDDNFNEFCDKIVLLSMME